MRLCEPEPVVVAKGKIHVRPLEMLERRDDVEDGELFDSVRIVQRKTVGQPGTAVVTGEIEPLEAEMIHHGGHVLGHLDLGIGRMV